MSAAVLQLRADMEARFASRFDSPMEIRKKPETGLIPTGIAAVDELLAGGVPRGALSEICGAESSGRTALAVAILGQATRRGECCAWIDAAGAFDPASAVEAGVELERLLWVNCGGNAEHALKAVDLLIQAGGFGLVVLDLGDTPDKEARRIPLASWFRLRHAAERTGAALVAVGRQVSARSCSSLQIEMRRGKQGPVWVGKLLRGLAATAESRKHYRSRTAEFTVTR
jgi:recombination protein RecA